MSRNKKDRKKFLKIFFGASILVAAAAGYLAYDFYNRIYSPNVKLHSSEANELLIPSKSTYNDVVYILDQKGFLKDTASFNWVARKMNYPNLVKAGRYIIDEGMNNRELVTLLRSGQQAPVNVVLRPVRTKDQLVGFIASKLEADSMELITMLNDKVFLRDLGYTTENIMSLFLENTYEFYWTTSARKFVERMIDENEKYWNLDRLKKADKLNLSPQEVYILASIVDAEATFGSEYKTIAGLYLNRLKKRMLLQADPTVIFGVGDFTIRRVLNSHLQHDSPYNTYLYEGLPPGPISLTPLRSVDAVLNAENHNYIYMCAKEDRSGYHNFATTYEQHIINARKFRESLNRRDLQAESETQSN